MKFINLVLDLIIALLDIVSVPLAYLARTREARRDRKIIKETERQEKINRYLNMSDDEFNEAYERRARIIGETKNVTVVNFGPANTVKKQVVPLRDAVYTSMGGGIYYDEPDEFILY